MLYLNCHECVRHFTLSLARSVSLAHCMQGRGLRDDLKVKLNAEAESAQSRGDRCSEQWGPFNLRRQVAPKYFGWLDAAVPSGDAAAVINAPLREGERERKKKRKRWKYLSLADSRWATSWCKLSRATGQVFYLFFLFSSLLGILCFYCLHRLVLSILQQGAFIHISLHLFCSLLVSLPPASTAIYLPLKSLSSSSSSPLSLFVFCLVALCYAATYALTSPRVS